MLGWFKAEADRASFSKRLSLEGSEATSAGKTLTATSRPSRVSRAFQTSPIPPAPRGEMTSYGPRRVPAVNAISDHPIYRSQITRWHNLSHSSRSERDAATSWSAAARSRREHPIPPLTTRSVHVRVRTVRVQPEVLYENHVQR